MGALDFARYVRPGDLVAWGQCGAEPCTLTRALVEQRHAVGGRFSVFVGTQWSDTLQAAHADAIDFVAYTGGGQNRALAQAGVLDILPSHYSQFEQLIDVDVLLVQVAAADEHGHYSLSIAHEYLLPFLDHARVVIAEVNAQAPWTHGSRPLRADDFDVLFHTNRKPLESARAAPGEIETRIAQHAAAFIEDGATLQFGLGAMPEAILATLADRRDLGVHSGMFSDAAADLQTRGVITNARKRLDRNVSVAGVLMGSERVYRFAHRNAALQMRGTAYTHDIGVLSRIDRFVAINSALEVDLTGQVNAEAVNGRYVGAVGGGVDFLRGAAKSRGGVPIVALSARGREGSRIVAQLHGPVSTPRVDAGVIVTEFGAADLRGLTLARRVRRMIDIAPPEQRAELEAQAHTHTLMKR
ncbi:acetyl-CoA hydrolase/transferase family protein [Paraburkholderia acidisoli]|uniref:Acetyl-CoA hydrolase n=1 Tax=Paraburkholderia acidisoli TaxID=2571748 RepID=A0A7Z2JIL0_9BURK|nr:acetyl-CoA hydrolase/transferase C-terminal domain-containing protein [Paraburkholderia acidisoli]QGZ64445.1 acetyl-CoA hydrolase [Paraburkholderia acidisoli]